MQSIYSRRLTIDVGMRFHLYFRWERIRCRGILPDSTVVVYSLGVNVSGIS